MKAAADTTRVNEKEASRTRAVTRYNKELSANEERTTEEIREGGSRGSMREMI